MNAQVVVFHKGKRSVKSVPPRQLPAARDKVKALKTQGIKAHLVYLTEKRRFPPPDSIREQREQGKLWCPYCGSWRWFSVPKFKPGTEPMTEDWFMNSFHRQNIKVCQWCHISTADFNVCKANGIWSESKQRTRRRKRRAR